MTSGEAITAAERLLERWSVVTTRSSIGADNLNYACHGLSIAEALETIQVVSTLRAALLQSQEALRLIAEGKPSVLGHPPAIAIAQAALLSPPEATKEPDTT